MQDFSVYLIEVLGLIALVISPSKTTKYQKDVHGSRAPSLLQRFSHNVALQKLSFLYTQMQNLKLYKILFFIRADLFSNQMTKFKFLHSHDSAPKIDNYAYFVGGFQLSKHLSRNFVLFLKNKYLSVIFHSVFEQCIEKNLTNKNDILFESSIAQMMFLRHSILLMLQNSGTCLFKKEYINRIYTKFSISQYQNQTLSSTIG